MRLPDLPFDRSLLRTALPGALLLLLGLLLLGVTEHADRLRAMSEDALGGFVLSGAAARPGPASDGHLVLVTGAPVVKQPARDPQFGVAANVPLLQRDVEMFQWNETRFGGPPGYELDWYDHPIDSAGFAVPATHSNPGVFPIGAAQFASPDTTVGGFRLDEALLDMIPGAEPFTPNLAHLPPNMAATFTAHDGTLVSSATGSRPQVGDLRISWQQVVPTELTVFALDRGGTLVPVRDAAGDPIAQVLLGRMSLADAVPDAPHSPRLKWLRRALAVLLAFGGATLLLRAWQRRDAALALAAAAVPLTLVTALSWFGVRMGIFVAMVLLAVFAGVIAAWRWRNGTRGT